MNTLALSSEYALRTGPYDHTGKLTFGEGDADKAMQVRRHAPALSCCAAALSDGRHYSQRCPSQYAQTFLKMGLTSCMDTRSQGMHCLPDDESKGHPRFASVWMPAPLDLPLKGSHANRFLFCLESPPDSATNGHRSAHLFHYSQRIEKPYLFTHHDALLTHIGMMTKPWVYVVIVRHKAHIALYQA